MKSKPQMTPDSASKARGLAESRAPVEADAAQAEVLASSGSPDGLEELERSLQAAGMVRGVPQLLVESNAAGVYADFFLGEYDNPHTRRAYKRHVDRFLRWCEARGLGLADVRAHHVGVYRDSMRVGPAAKRQALAALRRFFDPLVERHFCLLNPARATGNPRTDEAEGQTVEIPFDVIAKTIQAIDIESVVGLRDRAALAVMASTGCRVGALRNLNLDAYYYHDGQWHIRVHEKNSKVRDIPVRHDLQGIIHTYLEETGLSPGAGRVPMFRTAVGRTGRLREFEPEVLGEDGAVARRERGRMSQDDLRSMLKRRLVDAGFGTKETRRTESGNTYTHYRALYSPHSFRVTVLTDLIAQGEDIQDVAYLAGHTSTRTTQGYDRTRRQVKRNLVERIRLKL